MLRTLLQINSAAAATYSSPWPFWLLIAIIISLVIYIKKYNQTIGGIGILAFILFTILVADSFINATLHIPDTPFLVADSLILSGLASLGIYIYCQYKRLVAKKNKNEQDIKTRQRLIKLTSYLLCSVIAATPFILQSFGLNALGKIDHFESWTDFQLIGHIIDNSTRYCLFLSIIIFLGDTILNRIATPIHTVEDIRDIQNFSLYLRSFNADYDKMEKKLCYTINNLFPMYAIGDPNSILQPNGAERIYATDEQWKDVVNDLSNKSKLVLIRIGQTEGTKWEMNQLIDNDFLRKTIFAVSCQSDYDYVCDLFQHKFSAPLPTHTIKAGQTTLFFIPDIKDPTTTKFFNIKKSADIENVINSLLSDNEEIDTAYENTVNVRKRPLKFLFNNNVIPKEIRHSFNWGIMSPIVNLRHWPLHIWAFFLPVLCIAMLVQSFWPLYALLGVFFILGNRIEWLVGSWSSPSQFLKHQRREAKIIWASLLAGLVSSVLYLLLFSFSH